MQETEPNKISRHFSTVKALTRLFPFIWPAGCFWMFHVTLCEIGEIRVKNWMLFQWFYSIWNVSGKWKVSESSRPISKRCWLQI